MLRDRGNKHCETRRALSDLNCNHHHHYARLLKAAMNDDSRPRLHRSAKKNVSYTPPTIWDPNIPSEDPHIQGIVSLNEEAFPHKIFADADDFIMRWLFGSKLAARWSSVTPQLASNAAAAQNNLLSNIPEDTLLEINRKCRKLTHPGPDDNLTTTVDDCMSVLLQYEVIRLRSSKWKACAKQYAPRQACLPH